MATFKADMANHLDLQSLENIDQAPREKIETLQQSFQQDEPNNYAKLRRHRVKFIGKLKARFKLLAIIHHRFKLFRPA